MSKNNKNKLLHSVFGALIAGAAFTGLAGSDAEAQTSVIANPSLNEKINFGQIGEPVSGAIELVTGKSTVLQFDKTVGHALIANPAVADVVPMTDQQLYILAKEKGTTSMTLFDKNNTLLGVFDVVVDHDLGSLKRNLYALTSNSNIQVRSNSNGVVLSGTAASQNEALMAAALAEQVAPGQVLNALETADPHQVMLSVRIAEVQRTASKNLGLRYNTFFENLDTVDFINAIPNVNAFASGVINDSVEGLDFSLGITMDALEEKGVLTTLAEPTLVAVSGETAYFLAGGEFPVPVASDAGDDGVRIAIEFKEFGVKLAYTPTVVGDKINLVIEPEVSVLDPANGVILNNIEIPGLITRRASTVVDLKNGQSFAIAGLLQTVFEDGVDQIPGLGNIPIIGALARSSSYRRNETELMIVVTPYLVEPIEGSNVALPTDYYQRPSESELFMLGAVEGESTSTGYVVK